MPTPAPPERGSAAIPRPSPATESHGPPLGLSFIAVPRRQRTAAALLLAAAVAALVLVAAVNPAEQSVLPPCPTWRYLGVHCPGCGSTRATHWLLNGSLATAWRFNPLLVVVGAPLGAYFLMAQASAALLGVRPMVRLPAWLGYVVAAVLVAYMVVRNVPIDGLAWMRPPEAAATASGD